MTNFDGKVFHLLANTGNGTSNTDTVFHYRQEGDLVTARFAGGSVLHGTIIALHKGDYLDMIYQLVTIDHELRSGKALAAISTTTEGKIQLNLNWEWLTGSDNKGTSAYLEQ